MSLTKTIRSRSNKNIGDVIEQSWEITARTVIAEPDPGDRYRGVPPRLGIYEYEAKALVQQTPVKTSAAKRARSEPAAGGTRREASSVPITVRRLG